MLDVRDNKEVVMSTQSGKSYLMPIISTLGVVAFSAALFIAWPALAHIVTKMFK